MTRWEHEIVQCLQEGPRLRSMLSEWGNKGWECCGVVLSGDGRWVSIFFKRPLEDDQP